MMDKPKPIHIYNHSQSVCPTNQSIKQICLQIVITQPRALYLPSGIKFKSQLIFFVEIIM